jgi:hypothetical protein
MCNYVFPKSTKYHKRGEVYNLVIRKKGESHCWNHKTPKAENPIQIPDNLDNKEEKCEDFVQLENSP